ncbi:transposase [Streptomyces sp. NPDC049936]|uniref:transposase n=1 Tax=Streptomyces sp. NPDC049936 TaxID=3365599 RepID=UPI0037B52AA2
MWIHDRSCPSRVGRTGSRRRDPGCPRTGCDRGKGGSAAEQGPVWRGAAPRPAPGAGTEEDAGSDRAATRRRRQARDLGVKPLIARRGTEHGSGLGTQRWVVERAFAHLHWFRRLRIRWEIHDDIHEAFLILGCALICWRRLKK